MTIKAAGSSATLAALIARGPVMLPATRSSYKQYENVQRLIGELLIIRTRTPYISEYKGLPIQQSIIFCWCLYTLECFVMRRSVLYERFSDQGRRQHVLCTHQMDPPTEVGEVPRISSV